MIKMIPMDILNRNLKNNNSFESMKLIENKLLNDFNDKVKLK